MKRQKLMVGLCIPAALVGTTAGVFGIIYSLNKSKDPIVDKRLGDYTITFNPGNGRFVNKTYSVQHVYTNETLDRIPQPEVISNQKDPFGNRYVFAGWYDGDTPVVGAHKFKRDTTLTAKYVNSQAEGFHKVTFKTNDPTITFLGNRTVEVVDGQRFYTVNRPVAQSSDNRWFKHWKNSATGVKIDENTQITDDIVLEPVMTIGVTVTWDPNKSAGGTIVQGSKTTVLETGTEFSKFNQPQIQNQFATTRFFAGWEREISSGVWQKMQPTDVITENITVRAIWSGSPEVSDGFATLAYIQNPETGQPTGMTFAPTSFYILQTKPKSGETGFISTAWEKFTDQSEVVHPGIIKPNVTTDKGNYKVETDNEGKEIWYVKAINKDNEYSRIASDYTFDKTYEDAGTTKYVTRYEIYPQMVSKITGVELTKYRSAILPESETYNEFRANVIGGDETGGQDVTWHVYSGQECTPEQELTKDGGSKIYFVNNYLHADFMDEEGTYYVQAVSSANTEKKSDPLAVKVTMPYNWSEISSETYNIQYNKQIWCKRYINNEWHWWRIDPAVLCNYELKYAPSSYETRGLNGNYDSISRTYVDNPTFDATLHIGSGITSIPEYFCGYFDNFIGSIKTHSDIVTISDGFMFKCKNFNSQLEIPNTVTSIGDYFLYGCSKFNNGSAYQAETPNTLDLSGLTGLTSIGNYFMGCCSWFNATLVLPTVADLNIGMGFLAECVLFNKDITIPFNVKRILSNFMNNCCSYTSTVTLDCGTDAILESTNNFSASAADYSYIDDQGSEHIAPCPINVTGFKFAGNSGTYYETIYPETHEGTVYRMLNVVHELVTEAAWNQAIAEIFAADAKPQVRINKSASSVIEGKTYVDEVKTFSFVTTTATNNYTAYKKVVDGETSFAIYDPDLKQYVGADENGNFVPGTIDDELSVLRAEIYTAYLADKGTWKSATLDPRFEVKTGEYQLGWTDEASSTGINGYIRFTKSSDEKWHIYSMRMIYKNVDGEGKVTESINTYNFTNNGKEDYVGPHIASEIGRRTTMTGSDTSYSSGTHNIVNSNFYSFKASSLTASTNNLISLTLNPNGSLSEEEKYLVEADVVITSSDGTTNKLSSHCTLSKLKSGAYVIEKVSLDGENVIANDDIITISLSVTSEATGEGVVVEGADFNVTLSTK